jgi:hypothetical protein
MCGFAYDSVLMIRRSRNSFNKGQTKRRSYWPFSSLLQSRYGTRTSTASSRNGRLVCFKLDPLLGLPLKLRLTHADGDDRKRAKSGRTRPSSIRAAKKSNGNKRHSRPENQSVVLALANALAAIQMAMTTLCRRRRQPLLPKRATNLSLQLVAHRAQGQKSRNYPTMMRMRMK